ncbi:MAG: metallophosphoesterase [Planctomycetota bacterium]|nr:metallophosphoesterase [Planctomycetota bacterium]
MGSVRQTPRRHSHFRLGAARFAERVCSALGGRAFYRSRYLAAGRLVVRTETARVPRLPAALEGFCIVQISDLHGGSFLGPGDLAHLVDTVDALAPDVIALTGDFVTHDAREVERVAGDLARLRAPLGVYAVFGNHDYRGREEALIAAALPGVCFLRNASARVQRDGASVAFVGVEDLEEGRVVDLDLARAGLAPGDVEIVLCHNPLGARAIARAGCAAILSGHTHAGQIDLPFLRRLGPKHPGLRLLLGDTLLVTSRGVGAVGVPLRIGAPAEIVVVRLARRVD